jgi:polysaccharide pyruvyl transferase WcaK-like protein
MTSIGPASGGRGIAGLPHARHGAPRVGVFGLLGSGNIGNDGSVDAVLGHLRAARPDAVLDFMCAGPARMSARHQADATFLQWYQKYETTTSGVAVIPMKVLGKIVDAFRTASWVRRHNVVIVPGMGVLEATLPLNPWGFPYSLFLLCASGRLLGTKVALVNVGANVINRRLTRWLFVTAARLAQYRSYRDEHSRDAMWQMGLDVSRDEVYPDLVFSLPNPESDGVTTATTVGLGLMAYHGGNDDRRRADVIHSQYVDKMKRFVRWLVDNDLRVQLFTGDRVDEAIVEEVLADLRASRPNLAPRRVVAEPVPTLQDLMAQIASVDFVVATRYHNVLCALKLAKPTVSIGYAVKNDVLMADMGLPEFCQHADSLDVPRLINQYRALESRKDEIRHTLEKRSALQADLLDAQFDTLTAALFP